MISRQLIFVYYSTDSQAEKELIQKLAQGNGAFDAVICNHWAEGGKGAVELAKAVDRACKQKSNFKFLYEVSVSILSFYLCYIKIAGMYS